MEDVFMKKTILFSVLAVLSLSQANLFAGDQEQTSKKDVKKHLVTGAKVGKGLVKIATTIPCFLLAGAIGAKPSNKTEKASALGLGTLGLITALDGINDLKNVGVDIYKAVKNRKAQAKTEAPAEEADAQDAVEVETQA